MRNLPTNVSQSFRSLWCKSIDTTANSPFDFKGIRVGDLCQVPDDVIVSLESRLKKNNQPYEWMTQPKVLNAGISIVTNNLIAGDKTFLLFSIILDPYNEKAYLASFTGLICAAHATNSLNNDNPFRKALENKYGLPASTYTEYEQVKAQIDELEAQNNRATNQAITVREAKNARDVNNMLPALRSMLASSDKNNIISLTWDYEKGNKLRPFGMATVTQANPTDITDAGGCPIKTRQGRDFDQNYGFQVGFTGTQSIQAIGRNIDARNLAKQKEQVQNAPAPKF